MIRFLLEFLLTKRSKNDNLLSTCSFSKVNLMWSEEVVIKFKKVSDSTLSDDKFIVYILEADEWSSDNAKDKW